MERLQPCSRPNATLGFHTLNMTIFMNTHSVKVNDQSQRTKQSSNQVLHTIKSVPSGLDYLGSVLDVFLPVCRIFSLPAGKTMTLPRPKMTWRQMVHLAAAKQCQELMVVVRGSEPEYVIADYQQRL